MSSLIYIQLCIPTFLPYCTSIFSALLIHQICRSLYIMFVLLGLIQLGLYRHRGNITFLWIIFERVMYTSWSLCVLIMLSCATFQSGYYKFLSVIVFCVDYLWLREYGDMWVSSLCGDMWMSSLCGHKSSLCGHMGFLFPEPGHQGRGNPVQKV